MNNVRPPQFVIGAIVLALVLASCGNGSPSNTPATGSTPSSKTSNSPTSQGLVIPVTSNPIVNKSQVEGLVIQEALAENNVDPVTGKAIADRLMLKVLNNSAKTATGFEIFYTMTDSKAKISESYYMKLSGFSIAPQSFEYLYFDNKSGKGHFPENKFSLYRSSTNEVRFTIELSSTGLKPAAATALKSKGTGEKVD